MIHWIHWLLVEQDGMERGIFVGFVGLWICVVVRVAKKTHTVERVGTLLDVYMCVTTLHKKSSC